MVRPSRQVNESKAMCRSQDSLHWGRHKSRKRALPVSAFGSVAVLRDEERLCGGSHHLRPRPLGYRLLRNPSAVRNTDGDSPSHQIQDVSYVTRIPCTRKSIKIYYLSYHCDHSCILPPEGISSIGHRMRAAVLPPHDMHPISEHEHCSRWRLRRYPWQPTITSHPHRRPPSMVTMA